MEENQSQSKKSLNPMLIVSGVIVVLLIVGGIYLSAKKSSQPANQTAGTANQQPTAKPTEATAQMGSQATGTVSPSEAANSKGAATSEQTVNIEAGSYYFKPDTIEAKKGQKITIVMHSVSMLHNFNIAELNVHGPMVRNGDTQTFSFTAGKAGTFEYYCSVANHRQMGQVGKLIVQ